MKMASLTEEVVFNDKKPSISVLLETEATKEVRILLKKDQVMAAHKAPYPIIVAVHKGIIDFGVGTTTYLLEPGSLIALEANVLHDLKARENSIIRLSLSINDKIERVENVSTL